MKRFFLLVMVLVGISAVSCWIFLTQPRRAEASLPSIRAIWVTRYDYGSADDVAHIIGNLAGAGFTDVFFQIRGNGTAFYRSQKEPWAYELSGGKVAALGTDPGWDPLQLAIDCAKPFGLRIHAYMNVLPGWKGLEAPPASANQLWTAHPEWFMVDSLGSKMRPTAGWYAFLNPLIPEVREHLRGIAAELCNYEVAGIHLDYIRYPHDYRVVAAQHYPEATKEELLRRSDFSYDAVSQAMLLEAYGWDVSKQQVTDFRCESVTRVVRDISYAMQVAKPDACLLSASVMGNPEEGKHMAYQDSGRWAREGVVDWIVQMNYATRSFDRYLAAMKKAAGRHAFRTSVVMGIYCKNSEEEIRAQLETVRDSGCRGFALFSYSYLFDKTHQPTKKGRMLLEQIRP